MVWSGFAIVMRLYLFIQVSLSPSNTSAALKQIYLCRFKINSTYHIRSARPCINRLGGWKIERDPFATNKWQKWLHAKVKFARYSQSEFANNTAAFRDKCQKSQVKLRTLDILSKQERCRGMSLTRRALVWRYYSWIKCNVNIVIQSPRGMCIKIETRMSDVHESEIVADLMAVQMRSRSMAVYSTARGWV